MPGELTILHGGKDIFIRTDVIQRFGVDRLHCEIFAGKGSLEESWALYEEENPVAPGPEEVFEQLSDWALGEIAQIVIRPSIGLDS